MLNTGADYMDFICILPKFTFSKGNTIVRCNLIALFLQIFKCYLILLKHIFSSYLFILLIKTTKNEQDYLQFGVQQKKKPQ